MAGVHSIAIVVDISTRKFPSKVTYVSLDDWYAVRTHKWSYCAHGYAKRGASLQERETLSYPKDIYLHRFVLGHPDMEVDHINGDRLDNRRENLRSVTRAENTRNSKTQNFSGLKGVFKNGSRFSARYKVDGVPHYLGTFATPEEAHAAYVAATSELCPYQDANWRESA